VVAVGQAKASEEPTRQLRGCRRKQHVGQWKKLFTFFVYILFSSNTFVEKNLAYSEQKCAEPVLYRAKALGEKSAAVTLLLPHCFACVSLLVYCLVSL
jgi:hypothetical protein